MDTASGTELVSKFGSPEERRAVADWLRRRLALADEPRLDPTAAPPGWLMTLDGGMARLTRVDAATRRTASLIAWAIVIFLGLIWYGAGVTLSVAGAFGVAVTMLIAFAASWVTWSRREWRVRHGDLSAHTRFLLWEWDRSFKSARLEVAASTDSDHDSRYTLNVIDSQGKRAVASEINDHGDTVDLAKWLAARTGFPLTLPRQLQ